MKPCLTYEPGSLAWKRTMLKVLSLVMWLLHKYITPKTSYLFINNYGLNLPNYSQRARLRFMNFTQLEWTVWIKHFFGLIFNLQCNVINRLNIHVFQRFRFMFNVIKMLALFDKRIWGAFYETIFSELSHLVQNLKLRT